MRQLVDTAPLLDSLANRTIFGLDPQDQQRLQDLVYELWSGPAGSLPEGEVVMKTLGTFSTTSRSGATASTRGACSSRPSGDSSRYSSTPFDADTFDLARVRRCCQAYPRPDGMLIPACVRNVLQRGMPDTVNDDVLSTVTWPAPGRERRPD